MPSPAGAISSRASVLAAVLKIELDCALVGHFAGALGFRRGAVAVVVTYAEPDRHRVSTLLEAHLRATQMKRDPQPGSCAARTR